MELRQKLFLVLALMAVVPLLFLLFNVVERAEQQVENQASAELQERLRMLSREVHGLLEGQKATAKGLAQVPVVQSFAATAGAPHAAGYAARADALQAFFLAYQGQVPSIQALRFMDPAGRTLVKVKEGTPEPPIHRDRDGRPYVEDLGGRPFLLRAMLPDVDVALSDFELGRVPGAADFCPSMVRYSVPMRDEAGTLLGLLVINMWGQQVDETVEASVGGHPGKAHVVEVSRDPQRDGIYLYHQDPELRFANQMGTSHRFSTDIGLERWRELRGGVGSGKLALDDGRLVFYRNFAPYPEHSGTRWLLVIETSRDEILAPLAGLRHSIFWLLVVALAASLLAASWVAARLARPVHDLAEMIVRYADGNHRLRYRGQRRDEIGSAGRAFNYLAEHLERAEQDRDKAERVARQAERLAAVGEMAAGIGHEINNPLMNIMSLATLVEHALPPGEQQAREDLRVLQAEGKRCARIVQGILNFARETPPRFEFFDMAALIEETANLLKHRLGAAAVHLKLDVPAELPLAGDRSQLQQVLVNLLLNAVQASPADSFVTLRARAENDRIQVEILDNGPGLSDEALSRVFDPFFTTKADAGGTGLGLSVSYGIVKEHQGSITLENRPSGGARAEVVLPAKLQPSQRQEVRHAG